MQPQCYNYTYPNINSPRGSINSDTDSNHFIGQEEVKQSEQSASDTQGSGKKKRKRNKKPLKPNLRDMELYGKPNSIKFEVKELCELTIGEGINN